VIFVFFAVKKLFAVEFDIDHRKWSSQRMNGIKKIGRGLGKGLAWLGRFWQHLICWLHNRRRYLLRGRRPDYVVFTLEGELVERTPIQPRLYSLLPFFQTPITLESLTAAMRHIAQDPDVRGVLFLVKGAQLSLAQAQSLADLFARFRGWDHEFNQAKSRYQPKEVVVYLEQMANATYALAAAADRIVAPPLAHWNVTGLHSEPTFLADTLSLLGIDFDVVKIAPWKTAYDRFSHSSMSEANADQLNWLLDGLYGDLIAAIAQGRHLPEDRVRELIDNAPLRAQDALAAGLFDTIAYEDELAELLQIEAQGGQEAREARLLPYAGSRGYLLRRPRVRAQGAVGVITLSGMIAPGKSRKFPIDLPLLGDSVIGSSTVQQIVRAALRDDRLSAVVLHIDSGGGSAAASDIMWRELTLLARHKPLVIYMGNIAASGGYYIATPAHKIIAQSATLTGSIGVISGKPITTGVYEKIQAHRYSVQRGANADLYSDQKPWEGSQRAKIEDQIEDFYRSFKERVATGRNLPFDELDPICSGKVWTGKQAQERGLVDELGDFSLAVETACRLADLTYDETTTLINVTVEKPQMPLSARDLRGDKEQILDELMAAGVALLRRDWEHWLANERIWLLADEIPRIR
jgi:protease IV